MRWSGLRVTGHCPCPDASAGLAALEEAPGRLETVMLLPSLGRLRKGHWGRERGLSKNADLLLCPPDSSSTHVPEPQCSPRF